MEEPDDIPLGHIPEMPFIRTDRLSYDFPECAGEI